MLPSDELSRAQELMRACIQCGTCSASCPNEFAMDDTPRRLWRKLLLGQFEDIFNSRSFFLCSDCYCCTLRCPRGLPLTETMEALKRAAAAGSAARLRRNLSFYRSFMQSVRRRGRVNEAELMGLYAVALRNPLKALSLVPLGLRLVLKGKVKPPGSLKQRRALDSLFSTVDRLEDR